jgi:glycosyltransferase involved in cell wall biosynthesis
LKKKIRVLHIINNLGIGGAERVLLLLLEELSRRDDLDITLVSLEGHGDLTEDFEKLPIKLKKFKYHLFIPIFERFDPCFRIGLWLYAKSINPDIIHGHLIRGEDFAKVLGGVLGKPVITTSHDCCIFPGRKQKFFNRFLTRAVGVSKLVADHLHDIYRLPEDIISVIPNAIKTDDFRESVKKFDIKEPIFIYIGRLIDSKGVQFAIEGLAKLRDSYPKMKFLIFGDGWYRGKLEKNVAENKYDFVEFRGKIRDIAAALKEGDIFVLPSMSEGFSMAVLEAIAAGKPVIATKTGAIPEMLSEGKNGYFVKYGKASEIATAAKKLLQSDIPVMQKTSMEIAKSHFSIEKVALKYYNLYLNVLRRNNEK